MIITKLRGGLGNQLFQYAIGRKLADRHQTELKLDISSLQNSSHKWTYRTYNLDFFNINASIAQPSDMNKVVPFINLQKWFYKIGVHHPNYYQEPFFHFCDKVLQLSNSLYLDGYWQSEKYFLDIREHLLQEITPKKTFFSDTSAFVKSRSCSVSLHIRRGDYIQNSSANLHLRPCPLSYYQEATAYLNSIVNSPYFFVFSDDIAWAKINLKLPYPTHFVEGHTPYEDLILMSQCHHHIIANSTFSWWGAWIGQFEKKMVIAPRKWFNSNHLIVKDLLPPDWINI